MQLIKLLAPDQKMQRVPKALKVMGANRQEISLIGMVDIKVKFNYFKGDRCSSLTLKCVVAPEFDDGLLLSMGTMEDIDADHLGMSSIIDLIQELWCEDTCDSNFETSTYLK